VSCEHLDAMAALALGALPGREAEAARRHAETCEDCREALARHEATVRMVESELPRVAPPPLDTAALRPGVRRGPSQRLLIAAIAAAVAAILILAVVRGDTGEAPVATLVPGNAGAQTHGDARISGQGRGGSYLELQLQDVPPAPAGRHYEVWVLRRGAVAMSPLGTFRPTRRTVSLRLLLPGDGPYSAVDVSVQRDGGPNVNSGIHLASGPFEQK
jgi:ferric-dicitrate binding protein FerR (iron transport regulator)